eukprot:TRINITY_DN22705_c0_g1_i1.p1 TRINITY_DN22705_c0_g1~~TRINITY_DN22705_c0_g1_i1.p1  ORF type:complete len:274 (-),score=79.09 TRINITY_DN22705_c0_g1_i1:109-930(-)
MTSRIARRGVLMTASSKKTQPKVAVADVDSDEGDEESLDKKRLQSQKEWEEVEREVRQDRRRSNAEHEFSQGRRDNVAGYDDVAEEGNADAADLKGKSEGDASPDADKVKHGPENNLNREEEEEDSEEGDVRPNGVVTAGSKVAGEKKHSKRGGQKKSGAQRKAAKAAEGEKDSKKRKREEDNDDDRWVKLKLMGEQKPKRIDATRVVSYFDHDSDGRLFDRKHGAALGEGHEDDEAHPASSSAASGAPTPAGNFRASLNMDIWGDDSDDSEG